MLCTEFVWFIEKLLDGEMKRTLLIPYLILLIQIACTVTKRCPESASTRNVVNTCPTNLQEYKERAKERRCESISNSCDSFVYHCVPDTYLTLLQEICAPKTVIVGRKCAEWNIRGESIQSSKNSRGLCSKFESGPCPAVYFSTDLYKYPGCYSLIQKKSHEETTTGQDIPQSESNSIWVILAIIIGVIIVIAFPVTFIVVKRRGCIHGSQCTQCRKDKKTDEGEEKDKIEVSSHNTLEVEVYKNRQNNDKSRIKRGQKTTQSESNATESEQINKYDEYQKLIEEASHIRVL